MEMFFRNNPKPQVAVSAFYPAYESKITRSANFSMYLAAITAVFLIVTTFFLDSGGILPSSRVLQDKGKQSQNGLSSLINPDLASDPIAVAPNQGFGQLPQGVNIQSLKPAGDQKGSATVFKYRDGNKFVLGIEAKLPDSDSYFAWLAKGQDLQEPVALGKLNKQGEVYLLSANPDLMYSDWNYMIISADQSEATKPENIILSGPL